MIVTLVFTTFEMGTLNLNHHQIKEKSLILRQITTTQFLLIVPLLNLMLTMSPLSLRHFNTSFVLSFTTSLSLIANMISPASS